MKQKTFSSLMTFILVASLVLGGTVPARAQILDNPVDNPVSMPASPTDESKVPHYFGPYPNWALSPLRVPNVFIELSGGGGNGATAAAEVDPQSGALTAITITDPGSGYTSAPIVSITGMGNGAQATAEVDYSGVVTKVTVGTAGSGYTAPTVTFSGGGAATQATGTVYGGVDAVTLTNPGSGYQFPTVEFGLPNLPISDGGIQATGHVQCDLGGGTIGDCPRDGSTLILAAVIVDNPGFGYSVAPPVTIHDGTLNDPVGGIGTGAVATATLAVQSVVLDSFGSGYSSAPTVTINDPTGSNAAATAEVSISGTGAVTAVNITNAGTGYMTQGIKKFTDALPGLCYPGGALAPAVPDCPTTGKYIPLGVAEAKIYNGIEADEYVIGLVQYRTSFSSSLPDTLVRGYVQIETLANAGVSQHFPLVNEMLDGTTEPVLIDGVQAYGVTPPQYLGPTISATKDKPVRIVFYNLLPTNSGGDLFLPTDSSMMGSGLGPNAAEMSMNENSVMDEVRNPVCTDEPQAAANGVSLCFKNNRATLHLHGGITPWISDGTPHQWITPAGENTSYPEGVSVSDVPDMDVCKADRDGCQTFYYTNQQSARLLFYHDHSWGITRLNVYAGEAAGYLITDDTEQALINNNLLPQDQIPLIIQDKTFVPESPQLDQQDPTWDTARWGGFGSLWYHHVYMPAQNPGDPSGMSAYGRWMYGPWFWPPATPPYGPIPNPYYNPDCNLDDPDTWQYQTDPFCEPAEIPGTPNISAGMEQFNDTPIVNGVAYPTLTVEPKAYRMRILSAANDRFFNFQWYVADPDTASSDLNSLGEVIGGTEVAFNAAELEAAQTNPNVFPTPDTTKSLPGPDWVQIGTEGGFLPAPVVVDGQQVTTWITDPTRFDVGNVDQHSLLLAPAERADVIVDFSQFAGQTLILYNDAPAAFPARVPSYDYYTGAPDLSPNGAPSIVPGYGPNTRTIMQVKVATNTPAPAYNLAPLQAAFDHQLDAEDKPAGVFESSQHPIIVGQDAYDSAYGVNFAASGNCNQPGSTSQQCDGYLRINDYSVFGFNTLLGQSTKMTLPVQPKAIHDEMNSTAFDEFGRMQANLGVEAQPPVPGAQNVVLYPYTNPATELIDATNLPKNVVYDADGQPVTDFKIEPISNEADGTQIWRITHNGVDTHPIHFHLYDVQLINRVTWDNIIIPPDATELGWKDTVRVAPLEDTIVALRPIIPQLPFEIPNAIRELSPMMPLGSTAGFNNVDPQGNPTNPIVNQLVNFGWEYVYHCHILSHEEMDMMRPVSVVMPPIAPTNLAYSISGSGNNARVVLRWDDNSITETAFVIQSMSGAGVWSNVGTVLSPLSQPNIHQLGRTFTVPGTYNPNLGYRFRVVAQNTVGYGQGLPAMTASSMSGEVTVGTAPLAPTNLTTTLLTGPQIRLTWRDNATNETGFVIERSTDGVNFTQIGTAPARNSTGNQTFTDTTITPPTANITYTYRVAAQNAVGKSAYSNTASRLLTVAAAPAVPTTLTAALTNGPQVVLTWRDNATTESGFVIQRSTNGGAFTQIATAPALATTGTVTFTDTTVTTSFADVTYSYRVAAANTLTSAFSNTASVLLPGKPIAPGSFTIVNGPNSNKTRSVILTWLDNSSNETGFTIERATNSTFTLGLTSVALPAGTTTYTVTGLSRGTQYWFRIRSNNGAFVFSSWVNAAPFPILTNP